MRKPQRGRIPRRHIHDVVEESRLRRVFEARSRRLLLRLLRVFARLRSGSRRHRTQCSSRRRQAAAKSAKSEIRLQNGEGDPEFSPTKTVDPRVRPSHIKRSKKTMKIVRYNCAYYKHDSSTTLKPLPFIQTTLVWPHIRHTAFCRSSRSCAYVPPPFIVTSSTHRTPPHRAQSVPPGTIASSSF